MSRERRSALAHRVLARFVNRAVTCVVTCVMVGMLGACDGAVADPASNPAPAVSVTIRDANATIARGDSLFTTASIVRAAGSTSPIVFSAENVPAGVSVTFLPKRLESDANSTVVGILVDPNASIPSASIVIRATATDQPAGSSTVGVTVIPPSILLTTGAGAVTVIKDGPSAAASIYVARISSAFGPVTFVADSLPAGVTAAFPAASIGDRATFNSVGLTASSNAAVGSYTVRVRASMPGVSDAILRVPITVAAFGDRGFDLSAGPGPVPLQVGLSSQVRIDVQRFGDFAGPVTLSSLTLPAGFTVSAGQIAAGSGSTTLTFAVNESVAAGDYTLQLRGQAAGLSDRTLTVPVRVTALFRIRATSVTLPRGTVGTSSVSLTRSNGYVAPVTLAVVKLPAYLTAAFNPAVITGSVSNLIITAAANAPAGTTQVEVKASGLNVDGITLMITVVIPP